MKYSKNNLPSVAVLLAAYNGISWIKEQVDSIFAQNAVDIDLYLSVDLSNDGTYEWCQSLAKSNPSVTVLPYGEQFGGAAKNFFRLLKDVDFSDYDYVALADQDDIWLDNKLSHAIAGIEAKKVGAFSSDVTAFFPDGREALVKKSYPQKRLDHFFEAAGPGCTYVFRSTALQEFKQFLLSNWAEVNRITFHDWIIYAYFREHALGWHIDNKPLMRYRRHESNVIGANSGFSAYKKRIAMVGGGWYRQQVSAIFSLLHPSEKRSKLFSRLFLIKNFWQLRRHPKEAVILLLFLLLGVYR